MFKKLIIVFLTTVLSHTVSAQGDFISVGIGPSLIYGDNSGIYRDFKFKVQPAIALSVNKQISEFVGLRGSIGAQNFNSGDYDLAFPQKIVNWGNQDQALGYTGTGYFADFMPVLTTNPNASGMQNSSIQFFLGAGFGVMYVIRQQEVLKNGVLRNGVLIDGDIITSQETNFIPYFPIKTGISTNLNGDWDFALEFVLNTTLNSELDGNNIKDKSLTPDMAGQILFVVKRYFGPAW